VTSVILWKFGNDIRKFASILDFAIAFLGNRFVVGIASMTRRFGLGEALTIHQSGTPSARNYS
jgi:hypothetical protein